MGVQIKGGIQDIPSVDPLKLMDKSNMSIISTGHQPKYMHYSVEILIIMPHGKFLHNTWCNPEFWGGKVVCK